MTFRAQKIFFNAFVFLFVGLVLTCSASLHAEDKGKAIELDSSYLLQPGDRINVKIYPEDEYFKGGEVEVSSEGNITLPLVGKISIGQKAVSEAEKIIDEILAADYLVNPQVVIEVLKYQVGSFVVLGQIVKPGKYYFPPGELKITLLQAIKSAGALHGELEVL